MTFNGRRVLVVEGDFLVSLATTDLLKSFGCESIGPAASLAAAVQLAQSEALDTAYIRTSQTCQKLPSANCYSS
jgi:hypothetical protein